MGINNNHDGIINNGFKSDSAPVLDTYWKLVNNDPESVDKARLVLFPKPGVMIWLGHHNSSACLTKHYSKIKNYESAGVYATYVGHERGKHLFLNVKTGINENPLIRVYATLDETCFLDFQPQYVSDRISTHHVESVYKGEIQPAKTSEVMDALTFLVENKSRYNINAYPESMHKQDRALLETHETRRLLGMTLFDILRNSRINDYSFIKTFSPTNIQTNYHPIISSEGIETRLGL